MRTLTGIRRHSDRKSVSHNSERDPTEVVPFGRYGAGLFTGHPVGLVVVIGLLLMGLFGLPEARWFFAGALALGAIWGYFLWLRHR
jgi:hypothetical protein